MNIGIIDHSSEFFLLLLFGAIILLFLIIDLGFLNKDPRKISSKSALLQTIFWIVVSVLFGGLIYLYDGGMQPVLEYFSAYVTEKALSIDNIFVIILILKYFQVKEVHYHKILFWGILGAIFFRGVFIFLGSYLVGQFSWILYIFGAFLIYSGIKIISGKQEEDTDPDKNVVLRLAKKYLRITNADHGGRFFVFRKGKIVFTHLFLVMLLIETTDIIFAIDSIPAAFAITRNEFVIYTSNIFAVLGLRAMFFLLAGVLNRFYLLQKALSVILIFIGVKMLLEAVDLHIPVIISFLVIVVSLFGSIVLSLLFPQKPKSVPEPAVKKVEEYNEVIE